MGQRTYTVHIGEVKSVLWCTRADRGRRRCCIVANTNAYLLETHVINEMVYVWCTRADETALSTWRRFLSRYIANWYTRILSTGATNRAGCTTPRGTMELSKYRKRAAGWALDVTYACVNTSAPCSIRIMHTAAPRSSVHQPLVTHLFKTTSSQLLR